MWPATMTDDGCDHYRAGLKPTNAVRSVISIGFGAGNDRTRMFCNRVCRAKWRDPEADVVLVRTRQTTLAAFDSDATGPAPETVYVDGRVFMDEQFLDLADRLVSTEITTHASSNGMRPDGLKPTARTKKISRSYHMRP